MHFKTLALIIGLAGSAHAQVSYKLPTTLGNIAPVILPGRPVIPMILPSVDAVIVVPTIKPTLSPTASIAIIPVSLPVYPVPSIGPARLPGVPSPLPLPTPAALAAARRPGDEAASALVPNDPAPKPLSPAGALNALLSEVRSGSLFDGARPASQRELELPHNRYF